MIEVEIQEWQQIKAKLSQLQQELLCLKNQNRHLKLQNELLKNQLTLHNDSSNPIYPSHDQISTSQNHQSPIPHQIISKYSQPDIVIIDSQHSRNGHQSNIHQEQSQNINLVHIDESSPEKHQQDQINPQISANKSQKEPNSLQSLERQNKRPKDQNPKSITARRKSRSQLHNITPNPTKPDCLNDQLHLIQQICVYGPNFSQQNLLQVTFKKDSKQFLPPALYYPQNQSAYENYGNYLFPKKCRVKPTQKSHVIMEANKILFKSSKKSECSIFAFQANQNLHPIKKPHQILQMVNPSKLLYGLMIQFNDFAFQQVKPKENIVKKGGSEQQMEEMYEMQSPAVLRQKRSSLLELNVKGFLEEQIRMEAVSLKDIELQSERIRMYRGTFCLCIFTYFPFVSYLQRIVSTIIDEVKLKRIEYFPQTGQIKDCDIYYFIKEVDLITKKIKHHLNSSPVRLGEQIVLCINETQLEIDLSTHQIYRNLYWDWASKVIKLMERQVLYDIYCMVMLEESVMFVCEDQKLLTFIVLLFGSMITKPFSYPYPVVSILFSEELLQTPFTSIVGINQSQDWLRYAIENRVIDAEHKQIVMVSEKEVRIRKREGFVVPKSQNLKKIFTKLYKKSEPSSFSSMLLKKNSLLRKSSLPIQPEQNPNEVNQQILSFFSKLQAFYDDNILVFLPKSIRVERGEEEFNKVNIRNQFLTVAQKEYKRVNPEFVKDEFIRQFIKTQIFSIYLIDEYCLDS